MNIKQGLVISLAGVIVFTIILAVSVQYYYIPQRDAVITADCIITSCLITWKQCSRQTCTGSSSSRHCSTTYYTCYYANIDFILSVDDVNYTSSDSLKESTLSDAQDECKAHTITCYYKKDDIVGSLDLSKSDVMAGPITVVSIFTILLVMSLGAVGYIGMRIREWK